MKYLRYLFFILFNMILISCSTSEIKISSNFDHGSIGKLVEIKPGYFTGLTKHWLKRDSIGDQYYWFYFKADNVKNKELTIELSDLVGVYRNNPHIVYTNYTQPVFSYDQKSWDRIEDIDYDSASQSLKFSHLFKSEPVWIAYAHPYSVQRLVAFISSIRNNSFVTVEQIAQTKEGRGIELLTITNANIPSHEKITIFLMAMQHAGEDAGTYYMEGLVKYLISEDERAVKARDNFVYKLIPMMNPDGVLNGTSRYNMDMEDLNSIWLNEDKMQPEVSGVKKWVKRWHNEGNDIDVFLDIHNHTQLHTYNIFIFNDNTLDTLRTSMNKYWPVRVWHSEPKGSSHAYFHKRGISSGSVELTQSFSEQGDYLTISDYHNYGKGTVLGFMAYFGKTKD